MIIRVRRSPGGVDEYGDPTGGTETRTTLPHAFTAPRESADLDARGRQGVIVGLTLYDIDNTDLRHSDQIEVDGTLYDIDGEPGRWVNPLTGHHPGTVAALTRASG